MTSDMLKEIITGGQTGIDQAALQVAREAGITTGGTAAKGWMTEEGPAPWLADFGLVECSVPGYPARTLENVKNSNGTVIFGDENSEGSRLTKRFCGNTLYKKPCTVNPTVEECLYFIWHHKIEKMNVAGNRRSRISDEELWKHIVTMSQVFKMFKPT
jgi:hypothetical protein